MSFYTRKRLPQELVDSIIDHLHDDEETLRECTLVCKEWIASSSLHLFQRFQWPRCSPGEPDVCPRERKGGKTLDGCLQVLSSCRRLSSAVRELELGVHSVACSPEGVSGTYSPAMLFQILGLLPRLQILRLTRCRFRYEASLQSLPFHRTSGLRHVRLYCGLGAWKVDLSMLFNILVKFHSISFLEILCQSMEPPYWTDAPVHVPESPLKIEHLHIRQSTHLEHIFHRLRTVVDLSSVKSLSLPITSITPLVSSFVQHLPNLKRIQYCAAQDRVVADCFAKFQLDRIAIESSYFVWTSTEGTLNLATQMSQWTYLMEDLQILVSTNPVEIELRMIFHEHGGFDVTADGFFEQLMWYLSQQDWERLGQILQGYTSLKIFRLRISPMKTPVQQVIPALMDMALARLPETVGSQLHITGDRVGL